MTSNENELMEVKKLKEIKENIISLFSSGVGTTMTEFCVPLEIDNLIKHMENTHTQPRIEDIDVGEAYMALAIIKTKLSKVTEVDYSKQIETILQALQHIEKGQE